MARFLNSRVTIVGLLVGVLLLMAGISVAMAGGSASEGRAPSLRVEPPKVVAEGCNGTVEFDAMAAGFDDGDIILITLRTTKGQIFVGSGRPNATGGFMDHIKMNVSECGVLTLQAKKGDSYTTAPLAIVEHK